MYLCGMLLGFSLCPRTKHLHNMTELAQEFLATSALARYPFQAYWPHEKLKICITGTGGFIASHLAKRLKSEGHYIVAADWKRNEYYEVRPDLTTRQPCKFDLLFPFATTKEDIFCHEFHLVDLRVFDNCKLVCTGCDHVFNLAADMGGMGFIQSNNSVIMYNNTLVSFNVLEAARQCKVKR